MHIRVALLKRRHQAEGNHPALLPYLSQSLWTPVKNVRSELEDHEYTAWSYALGSMIHLCFFFALNLITRDIANRLEFPVQYTSQLPDEWAMIYASYASSLAISMLVVAAVAFGFFLYTLYLVKPQDAEIMGEWEGGSPVLEIIRGGIVAASHASIGVCLLIGCYMLYDEWNAASLGLYFFLECIAVALVLADVEFVRLQLRRLRLFRRTSSLV
ncbi:hypothetical protein CK203_006081 [Vitis vinifera]|uniref:Uncharacterized protein n=1 Tax=Vitis vinifera TaxID=29760 RepID=A0A438EVP1_VITVI|nr:hypothetical protein CK203_066751 [Vitis vinifera]RVX16510.1 hypothetical protein CK203_006081 [Vitis vinifera]